MAVTENPSPIAFVLVHFETTRIGIAKMEADLSPSFKCGARSNVEITRTERNRAVLELRHPNEVGLFESVCSFVHEHGGNIIEDRVKVFGVPEGIVRQLIRIYTPDFCGLLKEQLKIFKRHNVDILSHDGKQSVLSHPGNPVEFVQRMSVAKPASWVEFIKELQEYIYPQKKEVDAKEEEKQRFKNLWKPVPRLAYD